jgi:hypothetical protein
VSEWRRCYFATYEFPVCSFEGFELPGYSRMFQFDVRLGVFQPCFQNWGALGTKSGRRAQV